MTNSNERVATPAVQIREPRFIVLPGADQARADAILAALEREFEPRDCIEGLWLRDIAFIASRLEHWRVLTREFHLGLMRTYVQKAFADIEYRPGNGPFDSDEMMVVEEMARNGFVLAEDADEERINLYFRLQAAAIEPFLDKLKLLDDQEKGLLRERDRLIAQFDKRRRDRVIDAVRRVDVQSSLPSLSEN